MGIVAAVGVAIAGVMFANRPQRAVPALTSVDKQTKAREKIGIDAGKINIAISGDSGVGRLLNKVSYLYVCQYLILCCR